MASLGLKSYKNLLTMGMVTKGWTPSDTNSTHGRPLPGYRPSQTTDIKLNEKESENKITVKIQKMRKVTTVLGQQTLKSMISGRQGYVEDLSCRDHPLQEGPEEPLQPAGQDDHQIPGNTGHRLTPQDDH